MTVRECRLQIGMPTNNMAKMLGIPEQLYTYYEHYPAIMPAHIAMAFSSIVGVPLDFIFFR